ncbi:MAG TPA: hypothetical protein VF262_09880 [Burkholderiales bacterium]|jgi:hypothetical protein
MRTGTASAIALALLLAGCTPMEWVRPDATPEQVDADAVQCQRDAWYEANSRYWYYRPLAPMVFRDALGRPVFARPYGYASDPFGDPLLEEARLAQFCMRNKGYELAPVER